MAATAKKKTKEGTAIPEIVRILAETYPDARCALQHRTPWELLVATILSAQCTDERVNMVTPVLFRRFPTAGSLARAEAEEVESIVRSTGFFRAKTKSILGAARRIVEQFQGRVPSTMEELLTLPGVARKTANVVLGNAFGIASGVVVDTHVSRIAQRLGLSKAEDAGRIEQDLMRLLPGEVWIDFSHQVIFHGRRICAARKPRCGECPLARLCPFPATQAAPPAAAGSRKPKARG